MTGSGFARVVAPVVIALGVALPLRARAHRPVQQPTLPDTSAITPGMVDAGRRIFHGKGTCFACHGPNLEGGPVAPTLKGRAPWRDAHGGALDAIFYVVTHGVSGTLMVSHPGGISDADAVNVATYIWSVSHRGAKP